jgi:putative sigma-54 modulation protein
MKLHVKGHGIDLTAELREYIGRRIHFAFGRFAGNVKSLSVRLADVNGPGGGANKRCDIHLDTGLRHPMVVREQQSDIHAAVALAVERAQRFVQRQLRLRRPAGTGSSHSTPFFLRADLEKEKETRGKSQRLNGTGRPGGEGCRTSPESE